MNDRARSARVSIGLVTHNAIGTVAATLDSVLEQTFADFNVVISDDASSDGTWGMCQRYAELDERVQAYRQRTNAGGIENFNWVVAKATGEFFVWLSDHDRWRPEFLERCVECLDAVPSAVLCWPDVQVVDDDGLPLREIRGGIQTCGFPMQARLNLTTWGLNGRTECVYGLFRLSALRKMSDFPSIYQPIVGPDIVVLVQAALLGDIIHIGEVLFELREARDFGNSDVYLKKLHLVPRSEVHGIQIFARSFYAIYRAVRGAIDSPLGSATALISVGNFLFYNYGWSLSVLLRAGRATRLRRNGDRSSR